MAKNTKKNAGDKLKDEKRLKKFSKFVEGDDDLRKRIFAEPLAKQQEVFELFSHLEHVNWRFFLFFCSIPSTAFWNFILSHLSAVASGTSKNRTFCENISLLKPVQEIVTQQKFSLGDKVNVLNLVGASHALWFELADPNYDEKPNSLGIWQALYEVNPSRVAWEWWFDRRGREAEALWKKYRKDLLTNPLAEVEFEEWATEMLGLLRPKSHWFATVKAILELANDARLVKRRISKPYMRLVYTITKSIAASNQPDQFFDTYNIGCLGLMRAIARYAPSMSLAFPRFADSEIRHEIFFQLGNYNMVILPTKTWQRYRELEQLKKEFLRLYHREPTFNELCITFDLNFEEVFEIYNQISLQSPISLDHKVYVNEDSSAQALTLKDRLEDPQEAEMRELCEDQEILSLVLNKMSLRDRRLFVLTNNLLDISQDIEPDSRELDRFFRTGEI